MTEISGLDLVAIPLGYYAEFRRDPSDAMLKYGCLPQRARSPWYTDVERITACTTLPDLVHGPRAIKRKFDQEWRVAEAHPYESRMIQALTPDLHMARSDWSAAQWHVHVDPGLNRGRRGDAAGIAVGRILDTVMMDDAAGQRIVNRYVVPIVMQVIAPEGGEIYLSSITTFILQLRSLLRINLTSFSYDSFQSAGAIQELSMAGLVTVGMRYDPATGRLEGMGKPYSVDRTPHAHQELKEAVNEERVLLPNYPVLFNELRRLQDIPGMAPDHPFGGCFTGETRIATLDGAFPTIAELDGKETWVYSARSDGSIVPGRARGRKTKEVSELLDVVLDSGAVVRCTPEHLWMLRDGSYREARDLRPGVHRLMPITFHWPRNGGYEHISGATGTHNRRATHHVVYEAIFGPIPEGAIVHHMNHVKTDNRPENLEAWTRQAHLSYHAELRHAEDPEWRVKLAAGTVRFNKLPSTREKRAEYQRLRRGENHRVRALIPVRLPAPVPVYDLEVDEWSNFALAAGVFVHNSKDCADAVAGVVGYLAEYGHTLVVPPGEAMFSAFQQDQYYLPSPGDAIAAFLDDDGPANFLLD